MSVRMGSQASVVASHTNHEYHEEVDDESGRYDFVRESSEEVRPVMIPTQNENSNNHNEEDDTDGDGDRKPAAIPTQNYSINVSTHKLKSEVYDNSNNVESIGVLSSVPVVDDQNDIDDTTSGNSATGSLESQPQPNHNIPTTEDGRQLSEYEILRLERMKRNRDYLSQLGLENSPPRKKQKPKERTRKELTVTVERRSSISRRTKLQPIRYVGPKSIREMIQTALGDDDNDDDRKSQKKSKLSSKQKSTSNITDSANVSSQSTTTSINAASTNDISSMIESNSMLPTSSPHDDDDDDVNTPLDGFGIPVEKGNRMEIFIYKEFRRLRSMKRILLQKAERVHRMVEKEVKYWYNQKVQYDRKMKKKHMIDQYILEYNKQQQIRTTKKDLLHAIDQKMPYITQAIKKYDQSILAKERKYENDVKRWEAEEKLRTLDAFDWYPKALKSAYSKLDMVLLETSPIDAPAPRRSLRCVMDDHETTKPTPKIKLSRTKNVHNISTMDTMDGADSRYADAGMTLDATTDENDEPIDGAGKTTSRRQAKNIGGWISPDFATDIDRSWLESYVPSFNNKQAFDLSTYVPQIGDIVLYYFTGHRAYLDRYPDIVAKKNRGKKCRMPLWERAAQLRVESQNGNEATKPTENPWWTNAWIDGLQNNNIGDYPIICKVERTHAEFPPDPFSKVIESNSNDGTIVHFKKPKKFVKSEAKTSMRLAVTLRPLSYVVPPLTHNGCISEAGFALSVPPLFSVVTFPCELEPFIVPFMWGYMKSHFVSLNQKLTLHNDTANTVRVDAFVSLAGRDTMRIDDHRSDMELLLSLDPTELENGLKKQDVKIPFREARMVLGLWHHHSKNKINAQERFDSAELQLSDRFTYLLQSTLPLWQGIFIRKRTYDMHKPRVSAWFLTSTEKGHDLTNKFFNRLDEPLRIKIERALQGIMASDSEAKDLFFDPITEDLAPAYNCAVPLGISFYTVMQRLRVFIGYESCYYRSVEGILADVCWILDCCLLYNSPESEVVDIAANVVDNVKAILMNVVRDHYRQLKMVRSKERESPFMVLQPRPWLSNPGRKSRNSNINRDWLDEKLRDDPAVIDTAANAIMPVGAEVPFQVGDMILYSRNLHSRYIAGHCSSLGHEQCHIPFVEYSINNASNESSDWVQGHIVSTHAAFPKLLTRDEKDSFESSAILQCIGVKLMNDRCPCVLFWRPCVFTTVNDGQRSPCSGCGLTSSFIKLLKSGDDRRDHLIETVCSMQSILRCIDLLKHRCLNRMDPDKLDPLLLKCTDKRACKAPVTKIGKTALPSYDKILAVSLNQPIATGSSQHGTRGIILKPKDDDEAIAVLMHTGFLPRWITAARGGTIDEVLLQKLDLILPVTKLSLEYVSLKIKGGFYRHTAAIENDVIESYISAVYSLLFDAATRKKASISVRRISQLVTNENGSSQAIDITVEEQDYVRQIRRIRSLYGTALLSVIDVARTQRVFGLVSSSQPKRNIIEQSEENRIQIAARQKLGSMVMMLRRENSNNSSLNTTDKSDRLPRFTLNIKISMDGNMEPLMVKMADSLVRVNILSGGQVLSSICHPSQNKVNESYHRLSFGLEDYEHNEELARFLFSRPGLRGTCARCQLYNRTMVACRVVRKHVNLDCDWSTLFRDGIDFVDGIVKVLDPNAFDVDPENLLIKDSATVRMMNPQQENVSLAEVGSIVENVDENESDPIECLNLATSLSTEATELLEAAKAYSVYPLRLSRRFIEASFPIDKTDGHYLYCVVCGLSGDLLCCDGCANVVHAKCISLLLLPEGDWFCEMCTAKNATNNDHGSTDCSPVICHGESVIISFCHYDDYGGASFNESRIDFMLSQVENLRRSRPTQKTKEISSIVEVTENSSQARDDQVSEEHISLQVPVEVVQTAGLGEPVRRSLRQRKNNRR